MSLEQIIVLVLLVVGLLVHALARLLAGQREQADSSESRPVPPRAPSRERRPSFEEREPIERAGLIDEKSRGAAPEAAVPTRRRTSTLGSRTDLRRAIVLMTILGPCRSVEPPSQR